MKVGLHRSEEGDRYKTCHWNAVWYCSWFEPYVHWVAVQAANVPKQITVLWTDFVYTPDPAQFHCNPTTKQVVCVAARYYQYAEPDSSPPGLTDLVLSCP